MINKEKLSGIRFKTVVSKRDFIHAKEMFKAYEKSLDFKLEFQDFEKELNKIDEMYAPPFGGVILAFHQAKPVGCIGIRKSTQQ